MRVLLDTKTTYTIHPKGSNEDGSYILSANQKHARQSGVLTIQYHNQGILINKRLLSADSVSILATKGFMLNKKLYRGTITIYRERGKLLFINNVPLEQYLWSVVPSEVYRSWHPETLKAQAIAARTYALYERQRNIKSKNKFHVYADTRSQVYHGAKVENPRTTAAVNMTKSQVLTYQGQLIKAYFSSSIGGISASGIEIGDNKPYLQPVKSYISSQDPNKKWAVRVPLKHLQQQYKTTQITSVKIDSRTSSGRINYVTIQDSRGKQVRVRGDHLRIKIGAAKMKSTLARVKVSSGDLIIEGSGFGHGVGLGQWEAQELARRGAKYTQILRHFYKGTQIKKLS